MNSRSYISLQRHTQPSTVRSRIGRRWLNLQIIQDFQHSFVPCRSSNARIKVSSPTTFHRDHINDRAASAGNEKIKTEIAISYLVPRQFSHITNTGYIIYGFLQYQMQNLIFQYLKWIGEYSKYRKWSCFIVTV